MGNPEVTLDCVAASTLVGAILLGQAATLIKESPLLNSRGVSILQHIQNAKFLMALPSADTPLYNHPLNEIEQWLKAQGCEQDRDDLHCWHIERTTWKAHLCLEVEELTVRYLATGEGERDVQRSFKYSLSRRDIEAAVFSGP